MSCLKTKHNVDVVFRVNRTKNIAMDTMLPKSMHEPCIVHLQTMVPLQEVHGAAW